jgi:two-component system, OmpR family, sensor kinase
VKWHRHRHRRPLGSIGRRLAASLRRRIFFWFIGAMVGITAVAVVLMLVFNRFSEPQAWTEGRRWYAEQLAQDFDDVNKRETLAKSLAKLWALDLTVLDAQGNTLVQVGDLCRFTDLDVPIVQGERRIGTLLACAKNGIPWIIRPLLPFGVLLLVAWAVSEKVARRLARPLDDLADIAKRIGSGDWSARVKLGCNNPTEIQTVADAVNDMAARIEKQLRDQQELLATVSHEMRTPLARMRVIAELGRESLNEPKTFDDLDLEIVELDDLVGQLLAKSKIEFGTLSKNKLSSKVVASQALERAGLSPSLLSTTGQPADFEGDATLLHRALVNVLDNAKKHAGGPTELQISTDGAHARFEVIDAGPGFADGLSSQVFEKFTRAGGTSVEGLGLGLALVKRIATVHGGTVWALNEPQGGARVGFSVKLA